MDQELLWHLIQVVLVGQLHLVHLGNLADHLSLAALGNQVNLSLGCL